MGKRIFTALLLLLFICPVLAACSEGKADDAQPGPNILYVLPGRLEDADVSQAVYAMLQNEAAHADGRVECLEFGDDETLYVPGIMRACDSDAYDLIIMGSYNLQAAVMQGAERYPRQKFLCYDVAFDYTDDRFQNVASFQIRQNECGFLSGVLAAILTTSDAIDVTSDKIVGFVGAEENVPGLDFLVGYIEGVNYIDSEIEVLYSFVGNRIDRDRAYRLGEAQFNQGADVSCSDCGPAGLGNAEAALKLGHWNLNTGIDWAASVAETNPGLSSVILASVAKDYPKVIDNAISEYLHGQLEYGKHRVFGRADNDIILYRNNYYEKHIFNDEMKARYERINEELAAGNIKVGTAIGATPQEIAFYKEQAKPFVRPPA